jgi:tight adherence protein B
MLPVIAAACAFLAVFLLLFGRRIVNGSTRSAEARLMALRQQYRVQDQVAAESIQRETSSIPFLRRMLSGSWGRGIQRQLDNADIDLSPGEWVIMRLAVLVIPIAGLTLLFGIPTGVIVGFLAGLLASALPIVYMRSKAARRRDAVSRQLTEFLRLTANALRAGFALLQAFEQASRDLGPPLSDELKRLLVDTSMGANTENALREFADRNGSYEIRAMTTAILIQRSTGGNLAEVLDNVAGTMEERERLRGDVRTFTAQQRFSGNILSVYPFVLAMIFTLIHPSLMKLLVTEPAGVVLLCIAGTLQLLGFLTIRRILDVEY